MTAPTDTLYDLEFARHVLEGLSKFPKKLSSRYFYDARGDELFQQIMRMPKYYLTDAEYDILKTHRGAIAGRMGEKPFDLVELGAGDGLKTKLLCRHFLERGIDFRYRPIDISANVLQQLERSLAEELPGLEVRPITGEYFTALEELRRTESRPKLVLFMGANIGNFRREAAADFLRHLHEQLNPGDYLMVGFDLKKDPQTILDAYNDPTGITAEFNLNLLDRINRELGGTFDRAGWSHWESYDPITGEARSFLVSRKQQTVRIGVVGREFEFAAWEAVDVELSLKYSLAEIEELRIQSSYEPVTRYFDAACQMVDVLWQKK